MGVKLFGKDDEGRKSALTRSLYGMKTGGITRLANLRNALKGIGFKALYTDPICLTKPNIKSDGTNYYIYCLVYMDDSLIISENPKQYMDQLDKSSNSKIRSNLHQKRYNSSHQHPTFLRIIILNYAMMIK